MLFFMLFPPVHLLLLVQAKHFYSSTKPFLFFAAMLVIINIPHSNAYYIGGFNMFFKIREPVNTLTHLCGAILSAAGLVWMLLKALRQPSPEYLISALVFGASLILLYSASTCYHWLKASSKTIKILRKIDHSMIYVLIAGTYTPICILALPRPLGLYLLAGIWILTLTGIILKFAWLSAPRFIYTSFYLLLGWMALFFIRPIYRTLPLQGFALLLAGGLLYTAGAVIYAFKPARLHLSVFGFHEIFHLFILGGSLSHFIMVSRYLLPAI